MLPSSSARLHDVAPGGRDDQPVLGGPRPRPGRRLEHLRAGFQRLALLVRQDLERVRRRLQALQEDAPAKPQDAADREFGCRGGCSRCSAAHTTPDGEKQARQH